VELRPRKHLPAVLTGVSVAQKNVVSRKSDLRSREAIEGHEHDHPRDPDAARGRADRIAVLRRQCRPRGEVEEAELLVDRLGHAEVEEREGAAQRGDVNRLEGPIQHEHAGVDLAHLSPSPASFRLSSPPRLAVPRPPPRRPAQCRPPRWTECQEGGSRPLCANGARASAGRATGPRTPPAPRGGPPPRRPARRPSSPALRGRGPADPPSARPPAGPPCSPPTGAVAVSGPPPFRARSRGSDPPP